MRERGILANAQILAGWKAVSIRISLFILSAATYVHPPEVEWTGSVSEGVCPRPSPLTFVSVHL